MNHLPHPCFTRVHRWLRIFDESRFQRWLVCVRSPRALPQAYMNAAPLALNRYKVEFRQFDGHEDSFPTFRFFWRGNSNQAGHVKNLSMHSR